MGHITRILLRRGWLAIVVVTAFCGHIVPAAHAADRCVRMTLAGEVKEGQEWNAPIGQGWVFRVMPIAPARAGYSGWDLVVDREQPAGFPDALLLATMPYGSMNEREIGTTFGLRSQDAIGWNPRGFHFLTDPAALKEAQKLFLAWAESGGMRAGTQHGGQDSALTRLLAMQAKAASGEFRIVDARIIAGVADPAAYAQAWATDSAKTPHTVDPVDPGRASALGRLEMVRFALTLWLPKAWKVPAGLHGEESACPE